ncbi:hypothetical protein Tco_0316082 [Tanacetum coccineum]
MKNKEHDEGTEKPGNISETAKLVNEEFMTRKPTVSLKYQEWIHFATKCMIKGTDQGHWDGIWYISSNTNMHLCSKLNLFCNIKESFAVSKLDDQMKFLFTYGKYYKVEQKKWKKTKSKPVLQSSSIVMIAEIKTPGYGTTNSEVKAKRLSIFDQNTNKFKTMKTPQQLNDDLTIITLKKESWKEEKVEKTV